MPDDRKKALGQFFTPRPVADLMAGLARQGADARVMEPSCGEGVFLDALADAGFSDVHGFEVDPSVVPARHAGAVTLGSFVTADVAGGYDLVIGNPPYVRWKNMTQAQRQELRADPLWAAHFNSLCDLLFLFIARSVQALKPGGELVFITPAFWSATMHAGPLRELVARAGAIDLWLRFGEAQVFPGVGSSIVIFRFVKGAAHGDVRVLDYRGPRKLDLPAGAGEVELAASGQFHEFLSPHPSGPDPWVLVPAAARRHIGMVEASCGGCVLGDAADIANGMVSGLDRAFRCPPGFPESEPSTIPVVKARDLSFLSAQASRYVFVEDAAGEAGLARDFPAAWAQLQPFRGRLEARYDYGRGTEYWQWSLLRSRKFFEDPRPMVLIPCKERITSRGRLRLCVAPAGAYPTQDMTAFRLRPGVMESHEYVAALLSSRAWFEWVSAKGLLKGGVAEFSERPLSQLPLRRIRFGDPAERSLHRRIAAFADGRKLSAADLERLDGLVGELLAL